MALTGADWPIVTAGQVHGDRVGHVDIDGPANIEGVDALITDRPQTMLLMVFADCVPVYFCDPIKRTVAVAHAGWRGIAANIAGKTLASLVNDYDCDSGTLYAAIGPSISAERYEVGLDVVSALTAAWPGGSSSPIMPQSEFGSKFLVNLRLIVFDQLLAGGLRPENIAVSDECTAANRKDFFSHRRDCVDGGATGRMAGMIGMRVRGRR
jgi:YfiH family protein